MGSPQTSSGRPVVLQAEGVVKDYFIGDLGPIWQRLFRRGSGEAKRIRVLHGLDIELREGEVVAVVGPSGAGKTTLLQLLGGIDGPTEGRVTYRGRDVAHMSESERARFRNQKIGFVFQFYYLFRDLTALENVLLPSMIKRNPVAYMAERAARVDRARELLKRVGLGDREKHRPSQLSGGEQQRVAIARALMEEPEIMLCDEPTGNLDRKTGEQILDLLFELREEQGRTFAIVTHDDRVAGRAGRTVRVVDGRIDASVNANGGDR